jgi:hypothetical protein
MKQGKGRMPDCRIQYTPLRFEHGLLPSLQVKSSGFGVAKQHFYSVDAV